MALYAQIPKDTKKIKQGIVALEWQLNQDIPEKDREIFRQTLEAYKCVLNGSQNTQKNHHLGRLNPVFSRALVLLPRFDPRRHGSASVYCRFKAFLPSNSQEYGASRKNAIQGQNTSASGIKIHCTLTIIYYSAML